jgi:hypothetical protein
LNIVGLTRGLKNVPCHNAMKIWLQAGYQKTIVENDEPENSIMRKKFLIRI